MPVHTSRGHGVLWWLLLAFGVLLAIVAGTALWAFQKLEGNIRTDHAATRELEAHAAERPDAGTGEARNILVIGEDWGSGTGNARSDTVLLLHLSGDGERAEALNVPRDLVVDIPGCRTPDGDRSEPRHAQFNWAFQFGGAACTIRTFEQLTDVRVDHHIVVGFEGFADIVDAVGGVEVELAEDEHDPNVGHDLSAGLHRLDGEQALAYVRARVFVGDGSDLNRLLRQQDFLGRVYQKVTTQGTLTNPARLYPLLAAVTSSITADPGLDSLDALADLVADLRAVPDGGITFHTVPTVPHPQRPNRLTLDHPAADDVFADLRADRPLPERA
ncbi:LytR family transcriptional regulator [Streptomyces sp. 8K308]|uniref:LCP family protein n=1 Tax=Streptomyces sp. 8K308 TaxID=2530388 RepID=UPI0010456EFF|nr:LCP family protein [Streptomyces sp. 8K308]TDC26483.1 LytR family transcriptional regulator [Streptomyces sp. 8K308]